MPGRKSALPVCILHFLPSQFSKIGTGLVTSVLASPLLSCLPLPGPSLGHLVVWHVLGGRSGRKFDL